MTNHPKRSLYERALVAGRLLAAGWKAAPCRCCWIPPWEDEGPTWDEDEALALTESGA